MKYFFSLLFLSFSFLSYTQDFIPNEYIVQLEDQKLNRSLVQDLEAQDIMVKKLELIYPALNIYHLIAENKNDARPIDINQIKAHSAISRINPNHLLSNRAEPNDPSFTEQWALDRINASEAWELTTGGKNYKGDDIVIAVIDDGFDPSHEDLIPNLWINNAEIAGDGIDNDNNGYVDDINGANVAMNNGTHQLRNHGTRVCGIIGAKGDNNLGVTGINWDVKLMLISGQDSPASEGSIIEAYNYAKDARQKYNDTDGAEGAFVVATNSSWGIDNRWAEDFPIWCEIYNDLGAAGILSIAATSNNSVDVADVGDMPATCSSDYLIIVTNTDQSNTVVGGLGLEYIDIAAPGDLLLTTSPGDFYSEFGGTSGACPHVSGAVGLCYSMTCSTLSEEAIENTPGETALKIKSIILDQSFAITDMIGASTSGGLLDLHASLLALSRSQNNNAEGFSICGFTPNPTQDMGILDYTYPPDTDHTIGLYNYGGKLLWERAIDGTGDSNEIEIDLSTSPQGLYFVRLKDANSKTSFKIAKR